LLQAFSSVTVLDPQTLFRVVSHVVPRRHALLHLGNTHNFSTRTCNAVM